MATIDINKYCLSCGCELEKGEVGECSECLKERNHFKQTPIQKTKREYPMVPFPKVQFS